MLKIITYPDPVLRKVAAEVTVVDEWLREEMMGLKQLLESWEHAAGLAAPQLGVSKRFFGIKNAKTKKVEIYLNPKIEDVFGGSKQYFSYTSKEGKEEPFLEGCLSLPNLYGAVKRYSKIRVSYEGGSRLLKDYEAIVFQHELDHLDGILFTDHVKAEKGQLYNDENGKLVPTNLFE